MDYIILQGNAKHLPLADRSVQCCVTSPPYFRLRDYGTEGQIGMEEAPEAYVENLMQVMREVKRVLKDDGTLWLNLGDCFSGSGKGVGGRGTTSALQLHNRGSYYSSLPWKSSIGPKQLLGMPWRIALALQDDGWVLRSDIIYSKPNPMPESVKDRPTRSHEYVFLMAKSERYFYDAEAISEPRVSKDKKAPKGRSVQPKESLKQDAVERRTYTGFNARWSERTTDRRNARDVWEISPNHYNGAHFATMPVDLAKRCILAGSRRGDVVLDPFSGSGTTALAAISLGRKAIGVDLSFEYSEMAVERLGKSQSPLL